MQFDTKNALFFQFYKWVKRERTNATIDHLVCRQANDQSRQARQELIEVDMQIWGDNFQKIWLI